MPPPSATPEPHIDAPDSFAGGDVVRVALMLPFAAIYDYEVPEGLAVVRGQVVEVPIGKRFEVGVVWGEAAGDVDPDKIKPIAQPVEARPLPPALCDLIDWISAYTLQAHGSVLRMALSGARGFRPPKKTLCVVPSGASAQVLGVKMTAAREKVMAQADPDRPLTMAEMGRAAGVSGGVVKGLVEAGLLVQVEVSAGPVFAQPDGTRPGPSLSPDQDKAARQLCAAEGFETVLLEGVTGSGKTEVYFEAIAKALKADQQVLVMLPEIALTAQWLERFEKRFGAAPAAWHSDLTGAMRRETWYAVADGRVRVIVGARSALLLPFENLGLIIVDEEHDPAFKQEEGVIYNARDMAVVRAKLENAPLILATATPSLETLVNAQSGRYGHVVLPRRHGGRELPDVSLVDLRQDSPEAGDWGRSWLAPATVNAITETLEQGQQTLLFLNRRGYAPLTLCQSCGHRLQCPCCSAWLVEHRFAKRLQCHHCGYQAAMPTHCPSCNAEDSFIACGPGIERVAEEAVARWPDARIAVVSSDTIDRPSAVQEVISAIERHEVDLIIGTQLLAKGHNFPGLTLVGVVDADLGLTGWDLRAAERTFQLMRQVSGRAGRGDAPGRVLLQTYDPDHPVLQAIAANDPEKFQAEELESRRLLAMPPYGRLVALVLSGGDEGTVEAVAHNLARNAPRGNGIEVLGPAPAMMKMLRGRVRYRLLVKAQRQIKVQDVITKWLETVRIPSSMRLAIDIDPYSFM